jgi:hypothetical protein
VLPVPGKTYRLRKHDGLQPDKPGTGYRESGNISRNRKPETKISIVSRGEVAQLIDTINEMIDTPALFADQVTSVAREVGVDGKLGGQASVPVLRIWKNLTENVNQLQKT